MQHIQTPVPFPPEHPPEVVEEAGSLARDPGIDDPALEDLTHLPFVTIDEQQSRDLDQALFVERAGDGHVAWYAIADASHYVRPGTALFAEALRRGASYYLPGLVIPMLPRVLSEDIVSLSPGVDRRALVFRMALDSRGECLDFRLVRGRVRSRAKLAYEGVQAFYDGAACPAPEAQDSLEALREIGERRMRLAAERGVVRYRRAELAVSYDAATRRIIAWSDPRHDVERYGEQLSLLCNEQGARFLREGDGQLAPGSGKGTVDESLVQAIYRVHPPPEPEAFARLRAQIAAIAGGQGRAGWSWDETKEPLGEFLRSLPDTGPDARIARAIHRQAVLTNGRASFRDVPGVHYGVGVDVYARFSAPMREIVGVFLHKQAVDRLRGAPVPVLAGAPDDDALLAQVVDAANRAAEVQKRLDRTTNGLVLDQMFGDDLASGSPPVRQGTVMGMAGGKVYVLLDDPPIDVKAYLFHLEARLGERLRVVDDDTHLVLHNGGRSVLRVGDAVGVSVRGHDDEHGRWEVACERS